jgi:hypothetical protein
MRPPHAYKPKITDEPKPDLASAILDFASFLEVQLNQNRESLKLLALIDELDRQIAASTSKASRRRFHQARSGAAQQFARHLDANPSPSRQFCFYTDDGRIVWIVFEVEGSPSVAGRKEAVGWMTSRGQHWKGDTKTLRATTRLALRNGDKLPAGYFGFRVARTIAIVDKSTDGMRVELPYFFRARRQD